MSRKKARAVVRNPVAKFNAQFNRAKVFKDRSKYQRNNKHKGREPFALSLTTDLMQKAFLLSAIQLSAFQSIALFEQLTVRSQP